MPAPRVATMDSSPMMSSGGYTSESSTRLWEDLTPVPTRKNSIRFISTYAGFEGESGLLWDLYKQVVSKDEHPEGQGERLHPDLPIYANREARIFAYWDHEPRMPWQTESYYASQKKTLRPGTYLRLHRNQWATAEEIFITPEMWDPCVNQVHHPTIISREALYVLCGNRRGHQARQRGARCCALG